MDENPILNSPYDEPKFHYASTPDGSLDYEKVLQSRRAFSLDSPTPTRQPAQRSMAFPTEPDAASEQHLINLCRKEVGKWREELYPNTTRVTRELLHFWFANTEREARQKLFFAQQESVETAIWLNEVANQSNPGQNILRKLRDAQKSVSGNDEDQIHRVAFKMATGSGKTVVMACLIVYHYANRQEYRSDVRFADYFLVVAPGITIKDRLGVLFVDTKNKIAHEIQDYYRIRGLVPKSLDDRLENLNARLVITNYHSFMPRTLQGNKGGPLHRETQERIKHVAEEKGFKADIEKATDRGKGFVDVSLEKEGVRIACEVSVTTSATWEVQNILKCIKAGYDHVVVVCSQSNAIPALTAKIKAAVPVIEQHQIKVLTLDAFFRFLTHLAAPVDPSPGKPGKLAGPLLDLKEAAEFFDVSTSTMYRWAQDGRVPFVRVGRSYRFERDVVITLGKHDLSGKRKASVNLEPVKIEKPKSRTKKQQDSRYRKMLKLD